MPKKTDTTKIEIVKSAVISDDEVYRYELRRVWDHSKGLANFIGLNPSTADASEDDPTIRRCIEFAKSWGYGGLIMTNLFAYRLTDSKRLQHAKGAAGPDALPYLVGAAKEAKIVVCAWGSHTMTRLRWMEIGDRIREAAGGELYCIKQGAPGVPAHPLYLKGNLNPIKFKE